MELIVQRGPQDLTGIPGELFNREQHIGYTLERVEVAIPAGRYQVTTYYSPHFKRLMPLLLDIPGRSFIEMHWGNFASNSDGCILVGETQDLKDDEIFGTRDEFDHIFPLIQNAVRTTEGCWITLKDPV
jgi:Family of unknown function (DUF5675)